MDTAKKHDLTSMTDRLAAIDAQLAYLVRQQEKTAELIAEMTPILREVMGTATTKLDDLDKKGYFAFGKELVGLGERIVEGFQPDDVRQLGDAVVGILQTVRAMTQPRDPRDCRTRRPRCSRSPTRPSRSVSSAWCARHVTTTCRRAWPS